MRAITHLSDVMLHHHARNLLLNGSVRFDLAAELCAFLGVLSLHIKTQHKTITYHKLHANYN